MPALPELHCPYCLRSGTAANAHAAYLAGIRHFEDHHDTPGQENSA